MWKWLLRGALLGETVVWDLAFPPSGTRHMKSRFHHTMTWYGGTGLLHCPPCPDLLSLTEPSLAQLLTFKQACGEQ